MEKSDAAFRTIGEVSEELGIAQHVLRYWETRFPQLRPIQRAGNRRYYRPTDVALVRRIHGLLERDGYTVKGVQKLLATKAGMAAPASPAPSSERPPADRPAPTGDASLEPSPAGRPLDELRAIRTLLADALA